MHSCNVLAGIAGALKGIWARKVVAADKHQVGVTGATLGAVHCLPLLNPQGA